MTLHSYRLGIDAGGTFTDFVIADRASGEVKLFKALSTPTDPTKAIENGLGLIAADLSKPIEEIIASCDLCINGTTVGLNALITHRGGKTGLICTAGHEDSIEIRLGHKEDGFRYDPEYPPATHAGAPLPAPRGARARRLRRLGPHADERGRRAGGLPRCSPKEGVESVAISFVWSVLNPSARAPRRRDRARDAAGRGADRRRRALPADPRVHPHLDGRSPTPIWRPILKPLRHRRRCATSARSSGRSSRCATSSRTAASPPARRSPTARSTRSTPAPPRRRRPAST